MSTPEIRMYDSLKTSLSEEDAKVFIVAHNESVTTKIEVMIKDLATKSDLKEVRNELKVEINDLRTEFHDFKLEMREFKLEMKAEFAKLREEIGQKIHKASMIQTITIIGAILAIIFFKTK